MKLRSCSTTHVDCVAALSCEMLKKINNGEIVIYSTHLQLTCNSLQCANVQHMCSQVEYEEVAQL